jgi:hypothetical protein
VPTAHRDIELNHLAIGAAAAATALRSPALPVVLPISWPAASAGAFETAALATAAAAWRIKTGLPGLLAGPLGGLISQVVQWPQRDTRLLCEQAQSAGGGLFGSPATLLLEFLEPKLCVVKAVEFPVEAVS